MSELVRVTARMRAPISTRHDLTLDGILGSRARNLRGTARPSRRTLPEELVEPVTPVVTLSVLGFSVCLSTAWTLGEGARIEGDRVVKRREGADNHLLVRRYQLGSGEGRSHFAKDQIVSTPIVSWLAWVDSRRKIKSELRSVKAIGSRRRHGLGLVGEWTVERLEGGVLQTMIADGEASRPLPAAWVTGSDCVEICAYRSPYWHPARQVQCVPAGAKTELRVEVLRAAEALAPA